MNYKKDMARTPKGATLGERISIGGKPGLHYKAGRKEDDLTPEMLVECVTGRKVAYILYRYEGDGDRERETSVSAESDDMVDLK